MTQESYLTAETALNAYVANDASEFRAEVVQLLGHALDGVQDAKFGENKLRKNIPRKRAYGSYLPLVLLGQRTLGVWQGDGLREIAIRDSLDE